MQFDVELKKPDAGGFGEMTPSRFTEDLGNRSDIVREAGFRAPSGHPDHVLEGIDGATAAQIAAHHTRDRKELLSTEEVLQRRRKLALHGHQADHVVAQAREHGQYQMRDPGVEAQRAVTWTRDHVFERSAVEYRRAILEAAPGRGMGDTTYVDVRREFERRIESGGVPRSLARWCRETVHNLGDGAYGAGDRCPDIFLVLLENDQEQ